MHAQIQTGIPLIYEATEDKVSAPMPVGALHGITIGATSREWNGATVTLYNGPLNSTNLDDYAVVQYEDGTPIVFTGNTIVTVPIIKPGSYLIAVLETDAGSPEPLTVYIG